MSGGFFGFDTALPERRQPSGQAARAPEPARQQFAGFTAGNTDQTFGLTNFGEEEDLAVYQWGDSMGQSLLEGGDDMNDQTFGDLGEINNNFQFLSQAPAQTSKTQSNKHTRGPIASTASRYKPKAAQDPFAASEDDFYSSRPSNKKITTKPPSKPKTLTPTQTPPISTPPTGSVENLWANNGQTSSTRPPPGPSSSQFGSQAPPPPGQVKSLAEIEAEMAQVKVADPAPPPAPAPGPPPGVMSLEEIERQMMASTPDQDHAPPPAPREATPVQLPGLAGSGYASQAALLDSMFPQLGTAPIMGSQTASFPAQVAGQPQQEPVPTTEMMERVRLVHERLKEKIESMSRYNNFMGASDKDFITRIQLSQLATADPYTSDFYAQVFSALRRNMANVQGAENGSVVKVGSGVGFGVGGATANRFGKMGTNTMQKLTSQVKKLVESRQAHQKSMGSAALQGALGKVTHGNAAGPRPVLAVPTSGRTEHRPVPQLNQQSGVSRPALTKKQVMFALEELYDSVLDLEQKRRDMPPPNDTEGVERWNAECTALVEVIWTRLMVMEPLDVSTPHPFISLMNAVKGQRLFPRLLRHLSHQQGLTLLTLLTATYIQLDVVRRAPPPPVTDASLLTKADRLDRAKREVETDNFLHCVIPGVDMVINRCDLGVMAGLLNICSQRMDLSKVASTRPGVALFTALLSRAQSIKSSPAPDPLNPQQPQTPESGDMEHWTRTYAYFLQALLPHLASLFPSTLAQKASFGPGAYLVGGEREQEAMEMDRRDAEVWGFAAALAVNAPEEDQTSLVQALREKILHTLQAARHPSTSPARAEMKLRNVNMFLNGLGLDASMIE